MWSNNPHHPGLHLIRLVVLAIAACLPGLSFAQSSGEANASVRLPESLARWYKPQNRRQVWLHTMFAMRRELQAVREYAAAQDPVHLAKWSRRLGEHYRKLGEMVPEWRDETDISLVEQLQQAVDAGDFSAARQAADRLDRDCQSCHRQHATLTALRYRWPRFDELTVDDTDLGAVPYADHMDTLSLALNRVKIASEDGRWDAAQAALGSLRGQLQALGDGCVQCHDDPAPRERILGPDTTDTFDRLDQALLAQDPKTAGQELGTAAVQSCARCHGVHRLLSDVQRQLFD